MKRFSHYRVDLVSWTYDSAVAYINLNNINC